MRPDFCCVEVAVVGEASFVSYNPRPKWGGWGTGGRVGSSGYREDGPRTRRSTFLPGHMLVHFVIFVISTGISGSPGAHDKHMEISR